MMLSKRRKENEKESDREVHTETMTTSSTSGNGASYMRQSVTVIVAPVVCATTTSLFPFSSSAQQRHSNQQQKNHIDSQRFLVVQIWSRSPSRSKNTAAVEQPGTMVPQTPQKIRTRCTFLEGPELGLGLGDDPVLHCPW
jgi:hypothetical protein